MSTDRAETSELTEDTVLRLAQTQIANLRTRINGLSERSWSPRAGGTHGPELRLALGRIADGLDEACRLLVLPLNETPTGQRDAMYERVEHLLQIPVKELRVETAWDYANALQRELLSITDPRDIVNKLEDELAPPATPELGPGSRHNFIHHARMSAIYDRALKEPLGREDLETAVNLLSHLYVTQLEDSRLVRASADAKALYFWPMIIGLGAALAGAITCIVIADSGVRGSEVPLATFAGALGSTLGGTLKLRDRISRLADMRGLQSQIIAQWLVGAGAGLVMLMLLQSGLLVIGSQQADSSWSGVGLLGFVAGFSEPFFLGVVARVAGMGAPQRGVAADRPNEMC